MLLAAGGDSTSSALLLRETGALPAEAVVACTVLLRGRVDADILLAPDGVGKLDRGERGSPDPLEGPALTPVDWSDGTFDIRSHLAVRSLTDIFFPTSLP